MEEEIEVDSASDRDSGFEDQISNFTASITASVLAYPVENGRRYHAFRAGIYYLPNDELEQERLDLAHILTTKGIGDKLFLAPIKPEELTRVLDIGTGTGLWSMSMGDEYPHAEIIGNDLSAIQPPWVPPNVRFMLDDVESPWVHSSPFDFIFSRYMASCISDWPGLVQQAHDNLVPGGWVEFQDYDFNFYSRDGSLKPDSYFLKWTHTLLDGFRSLGKEPCPGPKLHGWLTDAGFENVTTRKFSFPFGAWAKDPRLKELGMINLVQFMNGIEAFSLRLLMDHAGMDIDEINDLLDKVRVDLLNKKIHAQMDFYVTYGQRKKS
jgi:SAM-dependent methyltransferase